MLANSQVQSWRYTDGAMIAARGYVALMLAACWMGVCVRGYPDGAPVEVCRNPEALLEVSGWDCVTHSRTC